MHRILVPADVWPIAPSGEQNAPGWTIGPGFAGGWVVFGGAGFVVFGAAAVVFFGAGPVVGTAGTSVATAAVTAGGSGEGLGESLGLGEVLGVTTRVCVAGVASGPHAVSMNTATAATIMRAKVMCGSST